MAESLCALHDQAEEPTLEREHDTQLVHVMQSAGGLQRSQVAVSLCALCGAAAATDEAIDP